MAGGLVPEPGAAQLSRNTYGLRSRPPGDKPAQLEDRKGWPQTFPQRGLAAEDPRDTEETASPTREVTDSPDPAGPPLTM